MASPPFKVKAIYEYTSDHEDDLKFAVGQVINVTELEGDDWFVGEYTDVNGAKQEGLFPSNHVEKYEPEIPVRPTRPSRPKQEVQQSQTPAPVSAAVPDEEEEKEEEEEETPRVPTAAMPQPPPLEISSTASRQDEARSPPSRTSTAREDPPPAPKPTPAEPAEPAATPAKKAPPPVAAKSNAFKDRIAAFNQPAAAPITPMQPGRQQAPSNFIKKPFVAPPPSKNAYVPASKTEPVQKPYVRDEDPEIRQREEEDRQAAEAAGFGGEGTAVAQGEDEEDAPKPMTLKERMALLQKQQQEQAARRAEASHKKERKPPLKKPSESSEPVAATEPEGEELERVRSETTERPVADVSQERPRVPSAQRRPPEPMASVPAPPEHEILSDGHEADQSGAGEMTEDDTGTLGPDQEDSDERLPRHPSVPSQEPDVGEEDDTTERDEDDDEEEEDEVDEETRRKEALRARMAKLGGGIPGMGAPFNPFGAPAPSAPAKKKASKDRKASEEATSSATSPQQPQQRIPMIPVPGMQRVQSPESATRAPEEEPGDEGEQEAPPPPRRSSTMDRRAPPPVPKDSRPVPPPPSQDHSTAPPVPSGGITPRAPESRPVPPPPPAAGPFSPGPGSESDDEMSMHAKRSSAEMSGVETPLPIRTGAPPIPTQRDVPPRPPHSPETARSPYFGREPQSATSDKRANRPPPPVPGSPVTSPRPPPPPPPTQAPPSRQSTTDVRPPLQEDDERTGSDYDGDYDTDIASSAKHKDALKAPHNRDSSLTENELSGEYSPVMPSGPAPPSAAMPPRSVPPPLPQQAPPKTRPSMDRAPPPVPPPTRDPGEGEEYDPYRFDGARAVPPVPSVAPLAAPAIPAALGIEGVQDESSADDLYAPPSPPPRKSTDRAPPPPPQERAVPPPPHQAPPPGRASTDLQRQGTLGRRSMEHSSADQHGQIANDIPLTQDTPWWTAAQPLPPMLQQRNGIDILSECEESSKSKRGGRKEIAKDIYVLYMDYSQTIISARYDSQEPQDVHLEQRHEPPPPRLRQDQLEAAWQQFGSRIAETAAQHGNSKKDSVVGDGTPTSLPLELIRSQGGSNALLPVGTRTYGALVYANLANASTQQYDEIRRGDIITLRNTRFEGHHGAMKTKYKVDYGASHVAIVEEWDGTRRAVRAWEQGREKKGGVRSEKFRLGDLRSGELRVWRVVGRSWVGWD